MATIGRLCMICIATAVLVGHAVIDLADRFIGFAFAVLAPTPQLALVSGDELPSYWSPVSFADPHVARHEAGTATRAAARGI